MTDINLQTITPDTTLPTTGFLFGADSQASGSPSVFTVQSVATTLLGPATPFNATITADAPVLNLAQTWNAGGVTFTGLKLNVTDTASAAGSLLLDLQRNNVSYASIGKSGSAMFGGTTLSIGNATNTIVLYNAGLLSWSSSGGAQNNSALGDLILGRRDTANLRFGAADAAAPVPQKLSVQSVVAGTSNTAGANLTITGSQGTGTGAGGSIIFQVAPAGSSGTAQNALATALTIGSDRTLTLTSNITMGTTSQLSAAGGATLSSPADSVWRMTNNAGTDFNRLQFGGTTNAFPALKRNGVGFDIVRANDSAGSFIRVTSVTVANLPAAATAGEGARAFVSDASVPVFGSAVVGGGAVTVPVYSTGAAWNVG